MAGKRFLAVLLMLPGAQALAAYDVNGVALDATEKAVVQQFPSAHCQPLQWTSRAADRRCDDARISFAGVAARVTFYLKGGHVRAFDVAFDARHADSVAAFLKDRYGKPKAEKREKLAPAGKAEREIYNVRWEDGDQRAVLAAQSGRRRATLSVSRGDFEEEIYRVR